MRSIRFWVILVLSVLLLGATASFAACQPNEEPPLQLTLDGEAYRGAILPVYAVVRDQQLVDKVQFSIIQGERHCILHKGQLQILNTAEVGATIIVQVQADDIVCTASCVVGHTPVSRVTLDDSVAVKAGQTVPLSAQIAPRYADDNAITYTVIEGQRYASVQGSEVHIDDKADAADIIRVVATAGGVQSAPMTILVTTIQPKSLVVEAETTLQRGQSAVIQAQVTPQNADAAIVYKKPRTDFADLYVQLNGNTVTVADDAPEGEFSIEVAVGPLSKVLAFTVVKTPVTSVVLVRDEEGDTVHVGDIITTACRVYPASATYRDVTYTVEDGAEYVQALDVPGSYRVTTQLVGVTIVIRATADGCYGELRLQTQSVAPQSIDLSTDGTLSVAVGETRTLSATLWPQHATGTVTYTLLQGAQSATLVDNVVTFFQLTDDNEVVVQAAVGNVTQTITFHVAPIPVRQVQLSTNDVCTQLHQGDTVVLLGTVLPQDATNAYLQYIILQGEDKGTISGNTFTVGYNSLPGQVVLAAQADGVQSQPLVLEIAPDGVAPTFTQWSQLDNNPRLFDNYANVQLDLRALPRNADDCVIVVSDDVDVLTVIGRYNGALDTCFSNLYFYFLTTDSITVCLSDMGIVIDNGFTDTVLDFGGEATVTLYAQNNNYVQAGHAYAVYTDGFMVTDASNDRLLRGMDGFAGNDGGNAVCAYDLTLSGNGTLTLVGGNGSSGTDATDGLNATTDATYGGNGGNGGNGGCGGYAVYAHQLTYNFDGSVSLYAGHSGSGGAAGAAGKGTTVSYNGVVGRSGKDGAARDAVYAVYVYKEKGNADHHMGAVQTNTQVRNWESPQQAVTALSKHYKVSIYYGANWRKQDSYVMSAASDADERLLLLHGLDYALQVFGHNVMMDLQWVNNNPITFYLCHSITTKPTLISSASIIYGLTDAANNVWLSAFETRKRDSLYSTPYNIAVHEIFHILHYNLPTTLTSLSNSALSRYNQGISYNSNTYGSAGVYDETAQNGLTCSFLTQYSKKNAMEDVSETLSLLCVSAQPASYTDKAASVVKKAQYINAVFTQVYASLDAWKALRWMRHIN